MAGRAGFGEYRKPAVKAAIPAIRETPAGSPAGRRRLAGTCIMAAGK